MNYTAQYPVKPGGVSKCMEFIEQALQDYRVGQRDLLEALLISEEALLLLVEQAPEDGAIRVVIGRRMRVPYIRVEVPGPPIGLDEHTGTVTLDQLGEEAESTIRGVMLRSYSDSIRYRHSRGCSIMTIITGIPERILATQTVSAIAAALVFGVVMRLFLPREASYWLLVNLFDPVQTLFISALMCITAPAVFVSITCSMFRFEGFSELGRTGKRVIGCYLLTSVAAALVGLLSFQLFTPGSEGLLAVHGTAGGTGGFSVLEILTTLIPPNIIEPFISVNSVQLTITALTIGAALTMSGKRVTHLKTLLEELDVLSGKVSSMVMRTVPVVVFCTTANVILNAQMAMFRATVELIIVLLAGLFAMLIFYCVLLLAVARLNPITFLRKYSPTMKSTFLKGSGVAAIPMTMRVCRRKFGIPQSICSFSIPLGATINMDGNCVCLTITSLFFARICGTPLDTNAVVILIFLVLILSLGAPIAPGTLILCLVTLLTQMGIDTGVLSLIIGLNFILEMLLGMVNSAGDVVIALMVARQEGTLDVNTYRR